MPPKTRRPMARRLTNETVLCLGQPAAQRRIIDPLRRQGEAVADHRRSPRPPVASRPAHLRLQLRHRLQGRFAVPSRPRQRHLIGQGREHRQQGGLRFRAASDAHQRHGHSDRDEPAHRPADAGSPRRPRRRIRREGRRRHLDVRRSRMGTGRDVEDDPRARHLRRHRAHRHGPVLPHVEDVGRCDRRPVRRDDRDHGHLLGHRLRSHSGSHHRLPHRAQLLAL